MPDPSNEAALRGIKALVLFSIAGSSALLMFLAARKLWLPFPAEDPLPAWECWSAFSLAAVLLLASLGGAISVLRRP